MILHNQLSKAKSVNCTSLFWLKFQPAITIVAIANEPIIYFFICKVLNLLTIIILQLVTI